MVFLKRSLAPPFIAIAALILSSCAGINSGGSISAMRPIEHPCRQELERKLSTINVAMQISPAELAGLLDRTVPKELYKGGAEAARVSVKVVRNGRIVVGAAGNELHLSIPVSASFGFGIFESPPLTTTVNLKLAPKVRPDWSFDAGVSYTGLSDSLPAEVRVGPLALRPRSVLAGVVEPVQRTLSGAIGTKLNEKFPLKAQAGQVWRQAQKPIRLDRDRNAWLVLSPRSILYFPLVAEQNRVALGVGVQCFADVVVGPEPKAPAEVPLPPLSVGGSGKDFRVALNTELFYKDLLQIVSPLLVDKEFRNGSRSVTIRNLDFYGNGDRLVIKVETAGSVDGTIYLTCRPAFDSQKNKLVIEDVEFDLQTRDLLVRSADWLLHSRIKEALQEKLNVDLTERLLRARELTATALERVKLGEGIYLSGSVRALGVSDVLVQRDRISLQVYGEGETAIAFH